MCVCARARVHDHRGQGGRDGRLLAQLSLFLFFFGSPARGCGARLPHPEVPLRLAVSRFAPPSGLRSHHWGRRALMARWGPASGLPFQNPTLPLRPQSNHERPLRGCPPAAPVLSHSRVAWPLVGYKALLRWVPSPGHPAHAHPKSNGCSAHWHAPTGVQWQWRGLTANGAPGARGALPHMLTRVRGSFQLSSRSTRRPLPAPHLVLRGLWCVCGGRAALGECPSFWRLSCGRTGVTTIVHAYVVR